jgi:hypothetical protein
LTVYGVGTFSIGFPNPGILLKKQKSGGFEVLVNGGGEA